jgi:DNA repair photolyase
MLQVVKLFGRMPNMLELSMNPCTQGCYYCYAKIWKREDIPNWNTA